MRRSGNRVFINAGIWCEIARSTIAIIARCGDDQPVAFKPGNVIKVGHHSPHCGLVFQHSHIHHRTLKADDRLAKGGLKAFRHIHLAPRAAWKIQRDQTIIFAFGEQQATGRRKAQRAGCPATRRKQHKCRCQGRMSAQRHLGGRGEPAQMKIGPLIIPGRDEEGCLRQVVLGRDGT